MECLDCEIVNTVSKGITAVNAAVVLVLCTVQCTYMQMLRVCCRVLFLCTLMLRVLLISAVAVTPALLPNAHLCDFS